MTRKLANREPTAILKQSNLQYFLLRHVTCCLPGSFPGCHFECRGDHETSFPGSSVLDRFKMVSGSQFDHFFYVHVIYFLSEETLADGGSRSRARVASNFLFCNNLLMIQGTVDHLLSQVESAHKYRLCLNRPFAF